MKNIIKGVATYTLLLIGMAIIFIALIMGSMFLIPKFSVFGWKAMLISNDRLQSVVSEELTEDSYILNIESGIHDLNIYQFNEGSRQIMVDKIDDMFGFYKGKYDNQVDISKPSDDNIITINISSIDGVVAARNSRLNVYLPHSVNYKLILKTTSGDVAIDGGSKKINLQALNVTTKSGDFIVKNVSTILARYSTSVNNGAEILGTGQIVNEVKDGDYKYYRYLPLVGLDCKTSTGEFNFIINSDGAEYTTIYALSKANMISAINGEVGKGVSDLANANENAMSEYFFEANRGEFSFGKVVAAGFNIIGNDILVKADKMHSYKDFYFNAPNGYFEFDMLEAKLSTIITHNIDVKINKVVGELVINTTYGHININLLNKNSTLAATEGSSLKSTHGNITVKEARGSVSAVSEHGNIKIEKYRDKAYLKNKHGNIDASFDIEWYEAQEDLLAKEDYKRTCEIDNAEGVVNINNIVFQTIINSGTGNINAVFYKMFNTSDEANIIEHKVSTNSGKLNLKVPNINSFMYWGTGDIKGSLGSIAMAANSTYTQLFTANEKENEDTLSKLRVDAKSGSAVFSLNI